MKLENEDKYETIRDFYKPKPMVKILFVGESRPASGDFFYFKNTNLYRYTKEAFIQAEIKFSQDNFLDKFKDCGCWLYDVCDKPLNNGLTNAQRRNYIKSGIAKLEGIINELKPEYIIVVKKKEMKELVFSKIRNICDINGKTAFNFPFPACGHQKEYVDELSQILKEIIID